MEKPVAFVLNGYVELTTKQREEFVEELNKYIRGTTQDAPLRKSIQESVRGTTMTFGPAPTGCPCCGK
jgi:hypothetical protein